uniref:Uncharacterized protein n=1 Tax=Aegilops tauschii subsp. strangulata TaxID=200361 RepID=A0A453SM80_AEGTS
MSLTCGEKVHLPSHKHLDVYTKDLVKQLRVNNVNLNKVAHAARGRSLRHSPWNPPGNEPRGS